MKKEVLKQVFADIETDNYLSISKTAFPFALFVFFVCFVCRVFWLCPVSIVAGIGIWKLGIFLNEWDILTQLAAIKEPVYVIQESRNDKEVMLRAAYAREMLSLSGNKLFASNAIYVKEMYLRQISYTMPEEQAYNELIKIKNAELDSFGTKYKHDTRFMQEVIYEQKMSW